MIGQQEQLDDECPGHIPVGIAAHHPLFKLLKEEAPKYGLMAHIYGDAEGVFFSTAREEEPIIPIPGLDRIIETLEKAHKEATMREQNG